MPSYVNERKTGMMNRSIKSFVVVLAIIGLGAQSTCNFLGDGTGNDNANTNDSET
jgi:hypothetical protein